MKRQHYFSVKPKHWWDWWMYLNPRWYKYREALLTVLDAEYERVVKHRMLYGHFPPEYYGPSIIDMLNENKQ